MKVKALSHSEFVKIVTNKVNGFVFVKQEKGHQKFCRVIEGRKETIIISRHDNKYTYMATIKEYNIIIC